MATAGEIFVCSTSRRLTVRRRPDVTARRHTYHGRGYWLLKDPLGAKYFRLQDHEYALFNRFDGRASLNDIRDWYEAEYPTQSVTFEELEQFVFTLHRNGLVIADTPGQGEQLRKRRDEKRRKRLFATVTNPLFIRFRGIDPERLLNRLYPLVRWFFTWPAVAVCAVLIASALGLIAVQFDKFHAKLPSFHEFFAAGNWLWLAAAVGVVKIIHEFGHGLMCKHFGGECHEMGVLLFVFTPSLYCNVSDSWMLPSKWQRAAIGAAGMYVELVMASIATFVWWFSQEGMLNQLALNTMFVCSVSTLLFNSNPLLRYDGYYILSDLMEIPNLAPKSRKVLFRKVSQACLGIKLPLERALPERHLAAFAFYAVASAVYRVVIVVSILWFLYHIFEPYRLKVLGQMLAFSVLAAMIVKPAYGLGRFFTVPGRTEQMRSSRLIVALIILAATVAAIVYVPLPHRVTAATYVQHRGAAQVYVEVPGTLEEVLVQPGQQVRRGDVLARLSSTDLELQLAKLVEKRDRLRAQVKSLTQRQHVQKAAAAGLAATRKSLAAVEDQIARRKADLEHLTLIAPVDGTLLAPPRTSGESRSEETLSTWSGTPFQSKNLGAHIPAGTLLCRVGDPKQLEALIVIDQSEFNFVQVGQPVRIKLDQLPANTFHTEVAEVAELNLTEVPPQLSAKLGGELMTTQGPDGHLRPLSTSYAAKAMLDEPDVVLRSGLRGRSKISVGYQSLGSRLWRYLTETFHFRL